MKIGFFEINTEEQSHIKKSLKGHDLFFFKENIQDVAISKIKNLDIVSVFIYSKIDSKLILQLKQLKAISTRSTGFDHVDVKAATKAKIPVFNVPFYGENTVAEHTFGLILSLSRNIHKSFVRTLENDFSIQGLQGFDLKGKTIGIIGGGHIGMHVARMARAFSMKVLVYDIYRNNFLSEVIGYEYADFDELLKKSDIISLHAPYNEHTHHLINKNNIKQIKKGAILINTARGGLIDTDALMLALEKKIVAGAGLDVIEGEEIIREEHQLLHDTSKNLDKWKTIIRDHKIFSMDNVIFTPHNAFNSREATLRILDTSVENIQGFLSNKYVNIVKPK